MLYTILRIEPHVMYHLKFERAIHLLLLNVNLSYVHTFTHLTSKVARKSYGRKLLEGKQSSMCICVSCISTSNFNIGVRLRYQIASIYRMKKTKTRQVYINIEELHQHQKLYISYILFGLIFYL